ncbi:MAG: hypothetical protein Q9174_005238 [Haloplaca sp. 1 TL-2023]
MPPSRTTAKPYVYAITRRDYEHHTDNKGRLALIEIHNSVESANQAAKAHLRRESKKPGCYLGETDEEETSWGGYEGWCQTSQDKRDNFKVEVRRMELKGGKIDDGKKLRNPKLLLCAVLFLLDVLLESSWWTTILKVPKNGLDDRSSFMQRNLKKSTRHVGHNMRELSTSFHVHLDDWPSMLGINLSGKFSPGLTPASRCLFFSAYSSTHLASNGKPGPLNDEKEILVALNSSPPCSNSHSIEPLRSSAHQPNRKHDLDNRVVLLSMYKRRPQNDGYVFLAHPQLKALRGLDAAGLGRYSCQEHDRAFLTHPKSTSTRQQGLSNGPQNALGVLKVLASRKDTVLALSSAPTTTDIVTYIHHHAGQVPLLFATIGTHFCQIFDDYGKLIEITSTQCKTEVGTISKKSVPTYTLSRKLLPQAIVVLSVSRPVSTVTPPAVTATDTVQTFTTTIVTASTATGTFSTTTTLFETDSITTTEDVGSTTTTTTTSTDTAVFTEPAPSNWVSVKNSTGLKNRDDEAILQDPEVQQRLQDDSLDLQGHWPPKLPSPPGIPRRKQPWVETYPESVTCIRTVQPRYKKIIIFLDRHTTTTTIPPATSTISSTQTVISTSTIVPDAVTVIESFSTTSTTTTTLTSVITDISTATELVNATTTITSYAACFTENLLDRDLEGHLDIGTITGNDPGQIRDLHDVDSAYDCCVSCLLSTGNCQYSTMLDFFVPAKCGRLLNPDICRGQDYVSGEVIANNPGQYPGQSISNGPCGKVVFAGGGQPPGVGSDSVEL